MPPKEVKLRFQTDVGIPEGGLARTVFVQMGTADPEDDPSLPNGVTKDPSEAQDWANEGCRVYQYKLDKVMPVASSKVEEEDSDNSA